MMNPSDLNSRTLYFAVKKLFFNLLAGIINAILNRGSTGSKNVDGVPVSNMFSFHVSQHGIVHLEYYIQCKTNKIFRLEICFKTTLTIFVWSFAWKHQSENKMAGTIKTSFWAYCDNLVSFYIHLDLFFVCVAQVPIEGQCPWLSFFGYTSDPNVLKKQF